MKFNNWYEFAELEQEFTEQPRSKRQRTKQRKWREIEEIKERQRMRRELVDYNSDDLELQLAEIFC